MVALRILIPSVGVRIPARLPTTHCVNDARTKNPILSLSGPPRMSLPEKPILGRFNFALPANPLP